MQGPASREEVNARPLTGEQVMTLAEVAAYLRLAEKTVLRMVHKGEIPCAKVASQWRFLRSMIDDWLTAKMRVVPRNDLATMIESAPDAVPFSRLVEERHVVLDLRSGGKAEVLRQLVQPLVQTHYIDEDKPYIEKLLQREGLVSTGVGKGVAIPHLRNPQDNQGGGPVLVVGICRQGTDFHALDGERTHLFFLICTDSEVVHLRVLAKVNRLAGQKDTIRRLMSAESREQVLAALIRADQQGGL